MSSERSFQWISAEVQFIFICIPTFDDGTRFYKCMKQECLINAPVCIWQGAPFTLRVRIICHTCSVNTLLQGAYLKKKWLCLSDFNSSVFQR